MPRALACLSLALPLAGLASPINHVVNGSFEANGVGNGKWKVFNASTNNNTSSKHPLEGWTLVSGSGIEVRRNVAGTAQEGDQFVELDSHGNSAMRQSFNDLAAGHLYELTFWYAARPGVAAHSNGIQVLWNEQVIEALQADGLGQRDHVWTPFHFEVLAQAGTNTLGFASFGRNDTVGGSLDNVSLTQRQAVPSQAVPLPTSIALLGLGLLAMGWARRRA